MNKKVVAQLGLFSNTIIWGGTFTIIKQALSGVSPMMFVSSRFLLAALILTPFCYSTLKSASKINFKQASILGFYLFIGFITQTIGLQTTTPTKSAFITGTFIVFTPIFQTILERRRPSMMSLFAILIATVGIVLLSSPADSKLGVLSELKSSFSFGDFLTLICAVSYALYIVYLDMISDTINYKFLSYWQILVTAVLSMLTIPLLHFTNIEFIKFTFDFKVIGAILYTALFATVLTTTIQTKFQKEVTPTQASLLFSMEPIFAAVFAYYVMNITVSPMGMVGCVLVFSAIIFSELFSKDKFK